MKYFVLILSTIFITLSVALPNREEFTNDRNNSVGKINKTEFDELIDVEITDNQTVKLTTYMKNEENERIWGKVGKLNFMIYKNMDTYLYIEGIFYNTKGYWSENNYYLNVSEFEKFFELEQMSNGMFALDKQKNKSVCKMPINEEEAIEKMMDAKIPIQGAQITRMESQLPGAKREYRSGFHEGFDWYGGAIGIEINKETEISPMFEGEIIRIDKNYMEMDVSKREKILADEATTEQKKYQLNLDKLRGRQIWVQSKNGVLVRYAHLSEVNEMLEVGDMVTFYQAIGKTGNSGTSNGVKQTEDDIHLHSDIIICGKNFLGIRRNFRNERESN